MENRKVIEWFENRIAVMPESETKEMFCMAVEALEKQEQDRWTPVSKALPKEDGCYLVTVKNDHKRKYSKTAWFYGDGWFARQAVIAWRPTPEPYKAEEES